MHSLLKADFFSLLKSKITYVVLGICVGAPLLVILLYLGLGKATEAVTEGEDLIVSFIKGRDLMFSTFSLSSNAGLIIPIFAGILVMADIRNGTCRNKVIIGKSKTKIYFSQLIVSISFCVAMILVSFLVTCGGGLIFFKYGYPWNGAEAWNFAKGLIIGLLTFAYVATLATFIALSTKSMPLTIVFTLLVALGLSLVCSLSFLVPEDSKLIYVFYLMPTYGVSMISSSTIALLSGEGTLLTNEIFYYCLASLFGFSALNTALGILIFNKADLK